MTLREQALRIALTQVGVTENPPNSNSGPMVNEYLKSAGLGPGFPWCMAFVHWCYEKAGLDLIHPNQASVGFFEDWARQHGFIVSTPQRGDIVCYRFDADNWPDHVGIVEEVGAGRINTVEGNTAIGNDANGGMVMRRSRSITRVTFARIPGDATGTIFEEDTLEPWVIPFLQWYISDRRDETKPKGVPSPVPDDVMSLVGTFADLHVQLGPPALFDTWADWKAAGSDPATRPASVPMAIPNSPKSRWWESINRVMARLTAAKAPLEARIAELEKQLAAAGGDDAEIKAELLAAQSKITVLQAMIDGAKRELGA